MMYVYGQFLSHFFCFLICHWRRRLAKQVTYEESLETWIGKNASPKGGHWRHVLAKCVTYEGLLDLLFGKTRHLTSVT